MPLTMQDTNEALTGLLEKYGVRKTSEYSFVTGSSVIEASLSDERTIPLQPWRSSRRFIELFKLVDSHTLEDVCQLRFSNCATTGTSLESILYEEFDLCEYIGHGRIVSVNAVFSGGQACNVILRLDNGIIGSIEASCLLPEGTQGTSRHEVVARRGVANDVPVDVQRQQQSIYLYTKDGCQGFRDEDFELYGLDNNEIMMVRAEFDFYRSGADAGSQKDRHNHLRSIVEATVESEATHRRIDI